MRSYEGFGVDRGPRQSALTAGTDEQLVTRFKRLLLEEVDLHELGRLEVAQRRLRLERVLAHLVSREGVILTTRERNRLVRRVVDESVGLGVLEPLLADPSVSEIMINGHDTIYVERFGRLERIPSGFTNDDQLLQTIDRIVSTVNRRVDESSPMVDARLPADGRLPRGARVNVVLPPLALNGPTVTIRLFPAALGMEDLLRFGSVDEPTARLLAACVRARLNIIVSGGTASGKTTMLNALSSFVPGHERIVTVEDAAELVLEQEHTVRLETRPANVEGRGAVTIRDLVRNSLRMRPDRIIVGEVRGGEALDMLQAMNTGHEGSLATVHANSTEDALSRLETLAAMSEVECRSTRSATRSTPRSTSSSSCCGRRTARAARSRSTRSCPAAARSSGSPRSCTSSRRAATGAAGTSSTPCPGASPSSCGSGASRCPRAGRSPTTRATPGGPCRGPPDRRAQPAVRRVPRAGAPGAGRDAGGAPPGHGLRPGHRGS
ncbi:CpaF family protein [Aquipuribacter hungaricus]|uniref:CpaF family protein n=1 Tax=Aquipuribacter hungaricus TaxID=545624 RepID=UPI003616D3C7